jgi:hypothetical protein
MGIPSVGASAQLCVDRPWTDLQASRSAAVARSSVREA